MKIKIIKTKKINEIRNHLVDMGDSLRTQYETQKDLKLATAAIIAYSAATKTSLVQVQYKKLTGSPIKIKFLEEQ